MLFVLMLFNCFCLGKKSGKPMKRKPRRRGRRRRKLARKVSWTAVFLLLSISGLSREADNFKKKLLFF